jgi:hypothetical protein
MTAVLSTRRHHQLILSGKPDLRPQGGSWYLPSCGFFCALAEAVSNGKDDAVEYPAGKRGGFFAHKFVRLMHKTALANDLGTDVVLLLVIIAHTEDAARYTGAVTFWNSQLQETTGLKKWERLNRCRKEAMAAGWLYYEDGGNRKPGRYWVTIPEGYDQISDAPIEPSCTGLQPDKGYKQGYDEGYKQGYDAGYVAGVKQGEPSIPVPDPIPSPVPAGADPERPTGKIGGGHEDIIIPESLNDPECRHVAKTWFQYLREKHLDERSPENSATQLQEWWRQMARKGRDKFLRDVRGSISHGWKTIRDVDDAGTSRGGQVRSAQPDTDPDFLRAVQVCKEFPSGSDFDREKRETTLGPELIRIVRKMTSARLAESDRYTEKQLAAEWKIVREGMK